MALMELQPKSEAAAESGHLQKFRLYETRLKFYLVGTDKSRRNWRVLKIEKSENNELNLQEDPATYSESECYDLLKHVDEGNRTTGGLKFVTKCYGIVGFIKFLGPYYMLLITRRKKIGSICGHTVYAVSKSEMITISSSVMRSKMAYSKDENRYKRLLCTVDITKDFFFSYSYNIMYSLQKNLSNNDTGCDPYESMFVWNEFLTRPIRNQLKNATWTVALVYGFFKQAKLSLSDKNFKLTLIARRSRHFAGTRYLKRGVNEKGRVANDVETEQIVFPDASEDIPLEITSVVQNRGSIPLFWSQETSKLVIRPDIILHNKDKDFEATRLHFANLVKRYGNPIIILNLIKSREKKPRESLLRTEFSNAIDYINKDLPEEGRLKFLHWDLQKHTRRKGTNVLELLGKVAANALDLTGFFYCEVKPASRVQDAVKQPILVKESSDDNANNLRGNDSVLGGDESLQDKVRNSNGTGSEYLSTQLGFCLTKPPKFQHGVLRTNCIDCLDRTNVAQYAYGLTALERQLHALGLIDELKGELDDSLSAHLMVFYEKMGDTLALQYGGSAAHNKIFCEKRGQWKPATQSQEFLRTLQRYYSNAYMDAEKQDAINLFLGYFQPEQGKPALWELGSDQNFTIRKRGNAIANENTRLSIKRSLSDGNILSHSIASPSADIGSEQPVISKLLPDIQQDANTKILSDSTPEISTSKNDILYSRCTPTACQTELLADSWHVCLSSHRCSDLNCSNFLDFDLLSSSGNSCDEETFERSLLINSPTENLSTENVTNGVLDETVIPHVNREAISENDTSLQEKDNTEGEMSKGVVQGHYLGEFSDNFVRWVANGGSLFH